MMTNRSPRDLLLEYRARWDQKFYKRHLAFSLPLPIARAMPAFASNRAAILASVNKVQKILKELEEDDWEVILGDEPSKAMWDLSVKYPMKERRAIWEIGSCVGMNGELFRREKWVSERVLMLLKKKKIDMVGVSMSAGVGLVFTLML